jgi:DNA modification methylase
MHQTPEPGKLNAHATMSTAGSKVYSTADWSLYEGDVLSVLESGAIPPKSVQCVVTSPPYFQCRQYSGGQLQKEIGQEATPAAFVEVLTKVFSNVKEVLADDGVCWINIGDCIAQKKFEATQDHPAIDKGEQIMIPFMLASSLRRHGWKVMQDVVWAKSNAMPSSSKKRCTPSHEYIFMLTKDSKEYAFDPIPIMTETKIKFKEGQKSPPVGGLKRAGGGVIFR